MNISIEHWWNDTDREKPVPLPHFAPQIPQDLSLDQSRLTAVRSQRLATLTTTKYN